MSYPVLVEAINGQFAAFLMGAPTVRGLGPSRFEAVAALKAILEQRIAQGEIQFVEIAPPGVQALAGKYRDDPTLGDICRDAYEARDAEGGE
jgi:hypothetical protein